MAITRIANMKGLGIFRDFTWPSGLHEFGRYNLVFGWNWSGKTTLSGMLRSLEARRNLTEARVNIAIEGRDVDGEHFADTTLSIRVFNRDFVQENVFTVDGEIAPIFVLGEENIYKRKQVDALKAEVKQMRADIERLEAGSEDAKKALDSYYIAQATIVRDTLRSRGSNPYNNYDKRNFIRKVEEIAGADDPASHKIDEDTKRCLLQQHGASPRGHLAKVTYAFPPLETLHAQVSTSLGQTVVSSVIKSLKHDPTLAGWVRDGLAKHKERRSDICLFCGKPLSANRVHELEAHFSDQYESFLTRINAISLEIESLIESGEKCSAPNKAELYDDLSDEYNTALLTFRQEVDRTNATLRRFQNALVAKENTPFEPSCLDMTLPQIDSQTVDRLNSVIDRHNKASNEFGQRVALAREKLENAVVANALEEFQRLSNKVRRASDALEARISEVRARERRIGELEREIVEHRKPAEEFNEDLLAYLGHDDLQLTVEDTGYRITRHGRPAHGLSEGERTAVALLYFLKSLNDRRFALSDGIVVLDDPVSSLDSNAIYSAFGFIKDRTKLAGQLFILTHNFTFFRQVRRWFCWLNKHKKGSAQYYMLDCSVSEGQRCSTIRELDPLLRCYESEYHYLFARVYRTAMARPSRDLQSYYFIPNIARRLLEGFLAFRVPDATGVWAQLQRIEYDTSKKERILRFLHAYSHSAQIAEDEGDLSILSETPSILKDLLVFIESLDEKHYSGMVSLVAASDTAQDRANMTSAATGDAHLRDETAAD
ncbi:MAG: AAA family ATPase [Sedimentisphaerales bacterium]|nr:AAA family ATPase [Sedimentisphaerales bacterium]